MLTSVLTPSSPFQCTCQGAVIDAPDRWGCTALYWAAFSGHQAVVDLLVSSGADPTIRNQQVTGLLCVLALVLLQLP